MTVTISITRGYLYICALLQELQKSQSLLTSAETELHHVKEMNVDLKRHNTLLEQEKLKVCIQTHIIFQGHLSFTAHVNLYANLFLVFPQLSAELKQAQTKLHQAEETIHSHLSQCEHQRQKIRELEAELANNSTKRSLIGSLQVELQTERGQLTAANKKVTANGSRITLQRTMVYSNKYYLLIISSCTNVMVFI